MSGSGTNWVDWHGPYQDVAPPLSRRLHIIQTHVRTWLDDRPAERLRALSLCSGDGRDLIEVLAARPDADRVSATLIEVVSDLADRARARASDLTGVTVRTADAGDPGSYADCAGADLVLLAGVFGNISDADVEQTINTLPMLCGPGAQVIWTRHRREPDLTPSIRSWFERAGFVERSFTAPADAHFTVGVHDFTGTRALWNPPRPMFTFFR